MLTSFCVRVRVRRQRVATWSTVLTGNVFADDRDVLAGDRDGRVRELGRWPAPPSRAALGRRDALRGRDRERPAARLASRWNCTSGGR